MYYLTTHLIKKILKRIKLRQFLSFKAAHEVGNTVSTPLYALRFQIRMNSHPHYSTAVCIGLVPTLQICSTWSITSWKQTGQIAS